jgi:hypothetical protein
VSSKDQEKEGFSIPAQLRLLREYATNKGFVIAQEFTDVETAKESGRTNFGQMLAYLRKHAGVCRTILVEKTDRLYRNIKDYAITGQVAVGVFRPERRTPHQKSTVVAGAKGISQQGLGCCASIWRLEPVPSNFPSSRHPGLEISADLHQVDNHGSGNRKSTFHVLPCESTKRSHSQ